MTHLDVQGCTEKICNVWPEDVKDVDSILDICFNHDGCVGGTSFQCSLNIHIFAGYVNWKSSWLLRLRN